MLKRILLLFLFFLTQHGFSQIDKPSDSLLRKSYKYLEGKIKNNAVSAPIKSVYTEAYLAKAKKEKDTVEIGHGFYYKSSEAFYYADGDFYSTFEDEKNYRKGLIYSDSIIYYTKELSHRIYPGLGYSMKGFNLYKLGFEKEALDNYLIAYNYARKHNNEIQLLNIIHLISIIRHNDKSNSGQTIKELDSLRPLIDTKEKYLYDYLITLSNLISDMQWGKKFELAFNYINEGIARSIILKDDFDFYNGFVFDAGINYYFTKDFDKALDSINKAESKLNITSLSLAYYFKGKIYQKTDTIKAITYFNKMDSIFQINQTPIYGLLDNYKSLIDIHKRNNNYSKQIENIDKLIYADSIIHTTKIYVEEKILEEYEIPNYKHEKEQIILELQEKTSTRKRNLIYLSLFFLIVSSIGINYSRKLLVYKKRYKSLMVTLNNSNTNFNNIIAENKGSVIPDETVTNLLQQLKLFEDKLAFLRNDISLNNLSKNLKTNTSYLSKVINNQLGKSFSNYINDLRIDYITKELKTNELLRRHTINAIAVEIGYNNSESFSKAFYKKTGIYPSFYIKQLNKDSSI